MKSAIHFLCFDFPILFTYIYLMFNLFRKKLRIAIGMSGGIDSTFVAWLLKKQGHSVEGITLHLVSEASEDPKNCCSLSAIERARNICKTLNIPHTVLTVTDLFKSTVIKDFADKYSSGLTPNPCILCNRTIKFGYLLDRIRKLGFDYLATGHYVVKKYNPFLKRWFLYKNKDKKKDQSYFLSTLTQEQLRFSLFPMAQYKKETVRKILKREKLFAVSPRESQDICFLPGNEDYQSFLKEHLSKEKIRPGDFVDLNGKVLGRHTGIPFYTIGQRRGLKIAHSESLYIIRIEPETNRIILGTKNDLGCTTFTIRKTIFSCKIRNPCLLSVKVRYQSRQMECKVYPLEDERARVEFINKGISVTPGQQAVFYKGNKLMGSGEIEYS